MGLFRRVAAIALLALVASCSGDATGPLPPSDASGTWISHHIAGAAMPAVVRGGVEDGVSWELRALGDTMIVRADGTWEQRVRVRQSQSDGFVAEGRLWDRGEWTRSGAVVVFQSTWIENVSFQGELTATGDLVVEHDFTLDEGAPPMRRQMSR